MIHSATLEEAIQAGLRQYRLHIDEFTPRLHLSPDGKTASLILHGHAPATPCQIFAKSTFAFHAYGLINWLVARRVPLSHVDLGSGPPQALTDTERIFNTTVRYGQSCTALHFDAAWLRLPVMQDPAGLREFLLETRTSCWCVIATIAAWRNASGCTCAPTWMTSCRRWSRWRRCCA
jgi:hypothetical protein